MPTKVYPIPPDQTREYLFTRNRVTSQSIYKVVIAVIFLVLLSLPFIHINISVTGRGIIRPLTEKAEIKALNSGRALKVFLEEGQKVLVGDTLLILQADGTNSRMGFITNESLRLEQSIHDLNQLLDSAYSGLQLDLYKQQLNKFLQNIGEKDLKISKARHEVERNKKLLDNNYISERDYENLVFDLDQALRERQILINNQKAQWSEELSGYKSELQDNNSQLKVLQKEMDLRIIKSPVTGSVEQFSGIYEGSDISENQILAIISPESELMAEVYISAKEIGYIQPGNKVNFQVDAFNYNEWGVIEGYVQSISDDYILIENAPVFKIKCTLEQDFLVLRNGVTGQLKKGMTLNARFLVSRKSLFQLIYQSADDWLNPVRY